jgi:hypothetical protein
MVFVIDNGQCYSSHTLYFVDAPKDFGAWFEEVLIPWLQSHAHIQGYMKIVATTTSLTWRSVKGGTLDWDEFLGDIESYNYDETPLQPRPKYRLEESDGR